MFNCASSRANGTRFIPWKAHIRMMAAAQPFISGAISKTVNMPKDATPDDVADAYREGWRLGLKALAIYRDGSKEVQPVSTKSNGDKAADKLVSAPRRERLPDTRQSITHKFNISGHEGYITVGLYPDGRPGELFITMAKEGSTIGGLMDCFGTAVSMSLQYGVPLEVYVNKFSHTRFEPMGFTKNPDIRIAKSLVDYIFRWLGITFLPGYAEANHAALPSPSEAPPNGGDAGAATSARRHEGRRAGCWARTGQDQRGGCGQRLGKRLGPTASATALRPMVGLAARDEANRRRHGAGRRHAAASGRGGAGRSVLRPGRPQRTVRQFPDRRPQLRPLRRDHGVAPATATSATTAATAWAVRERGISEAAVRSRSPLPPGEG